MIQGAVQGDVAERGTADAHDDEIIAARLDFTGEGHDFIGELRVVGQLAEAEGALLHRVGGKGKFGPERVKFGIGDAVFADTFGHQIIEIVA